MLALKLVWSCGVLEELLHDRVGRAVALHLDHDPHAVSVAFVANVANVGDLLGADEVRHLLDEGRLVDLVRQLGHHDGHAARADLLEGDLAADDDPTTTGGVHVADGVDPLLLAGDRVALILEAEDGAAGREVGAGDDLAQVVDRQIGVVDQRADGAGDLVEVVRRDVRGHADRDARRPVDEEVRQLRGEHRRLAEAAVVVVDEVDGLLLDVGQHLVGDRRHPRLGVAHGGRRVAVHGAEVALAVDQRVAQAEVLGHAHQRLVQRQVAVGVVLRHRLADDAGALPIGGVGAQPHLVHRVQDPPMHRLQAVAHVRQRARDDHAHRVVDVRGAHLVLDRHRPDVADPIHLHRSVPLGCQRIYRIYARARRSACRVCRHSAPTPGVMPYRALSSALSLGLAPR